MFDFQGNNIGNKMTFKLSDLKVNTVIIYNPELGGGIFKILKINFRKDNYIMADLLIERSSFQGNSIAMSSKGDIIKNCAIHREVCRIYGKSASHPLTNIFK